MALTRVTKTNKNGFLFSENTGEMPKLNFIDKKCSIMVMIKM